MKKLFYSIAVTMCCLVSSCISDMDKIELSSNALLPEEAWRQPASYEQVLAKLYAGFATSGNQGPNGYDDISASDQGEATFVRSYFTLQEFPTDEVRVAWKNNTLDDLQFSRWSSDNYFLGLSYNRMFMNIAYCNEYLRETTTDKMDSRGIPANIQANVAVYREEARVLRAMNYYFLMDLFGNVPIILESDGIGAFLPEQKSRREIFQWIEGELATIGQLPSKADYGRVNSAVVSMLLAKMYLNAEVYIGENRYTDCITKLKEVISAGYTLEPTYKHLFGADNGTSPEIIYGIVYDGKKTTTWGGLTFMIGFEAASDMNAGATFGLNQVWSGGRAPKNFFTMFSEGDERALFWSENRTEDIIDLYDPKQGWSVVKYTNLKRNGEPGSDNTYADTDFPLWRLADAYLMYAEAVVRGGTGGTMAQALLYVNDIQRRAGLAGNISENQLTLEFIRDERARELYWEAHRRTDLIRFNNFTRNYSWPWKGGTITGIQNLDSRYNLYPLPSAELSVNTNLKQNTGY